LTLNLALPALLLALAIRPCQEQDISAHVKNLSSEDFVEQGRAAKALEMMGPAVISRLRSLSVAADGVPDVQAWCRRIADKIEANESRFRPWIEKLGSSDDEEKDAAERQILKAGPVVIPFLKRELGTDNKNLRLRAEKLIHALSSEGNLAALMWSRLEPGSWMAVPVQTLSVAKASITPDSRIAVVDDKIGNDVGSHIEISALPMPWDQVAGIEVKIRPLSSTHSYLVIGVGGPMTWHILGFQSKEPLGFYALHPAGEVKAIADTGALVGRAPEYVLRIENMGKRWRFRVGEIEVKSIDASVFPVPSTMRFVVNDGRTEFFDLKVRKK
jgi:hypothetical protein